MIVLAPRLLASGGDRWLGQWEKFGLPGDRPSGDGPRLVADWPPRLRWNDVRWSSGSGLSATGRTLELQFDLWPLLAGRFHVKGLYADQVRIETETAIPSWVDWIVAGFATEDSGEALEPVREDTTDPRFILEVDSLTIGTMQIGLSRVSGRAWAPRRGSWRAAAQASPSPGSVLQLRAGGSGIPETGHVYVEVISATGRTLQYEADRSIDGQVDWRIQGRDDGSFFRGSIPAFLLPPSYECRGVIDLRLSGSSAGDTEGEVVLQAVQIGAPGKDPWNLEGSICLAGREASFEEWRLEHGRSSLRLVGLCPLETSALPGTFHVNGEWEGQPVTADGTTQLLDDTLRVVVTTLRRGEAEAGPLRLSWILGPGSGGTALVSEDRFGFDGRLGPGTIRYLGGSGSAESPLHVRLEDGPAKRVMPWLPFSLPGTWEGSIDTDAHLVRSAEGWRGTGTTRLTSGRIRGLPIVDRLVQWGAPGGGTTGVDVEHLTTRWWFDPAGLLADSLVVASRVLRLSGAVRYEFSDSLFGLVRLTPSRDRTVGLLLQLLGGGDDSVVLGLEGTGSSPAITPFSGGEEAEWSQRLSALRHRLDEKVRSRP